MSSGKETLQITSKPAVDEAQAIKLVETLFGLQVSRVKPLPGYDDQNFYIQTWDDGTTTQGEYVLKIMNSEDSKNAELVEVQTCAMKFLHDEGLPTPNAQLTKTGEIMSLEPIDYGGVIQKHMVRLLTYLPGTPVAEIKTTPEILFDIGKTAAILDETLTKKFQHPYKKSFERGDFIWNLSNTPLLRKYIYAIKDENLRQIIEGVITDFESSVKQNLKRFRQCVNHGDLNDHNLLVEKINISNGNGSNQNRVSGILDFGDMSYGCYIFEVAITIMYMMIESSDPLPVGGYVLAGYESVVPLTKEEKEALFTLVCCRFAQSLVMARYSVLLCPENEEYLMITAKTGWKHLKTLHNKGKAVIEKIWEDTSRSYLENNHEH
ncbi:hydroxylysine kinase [Bufo gargarizans]|uniref:hydroxylysine kinase n=1 Tax=Bufo gargarizans TaxID=30331 RepID=UPI001CF11775|nr:hydroxylysine kinase [Bufo gargarizans]XP_044135712.1 hydroxylysine kinase [Bufo gargarizans]